jgi:hypothetical protein
VPECVDERLLSEILGELVVAEAPSEKAVQAKMVSLDEDREGIEIACMGIDDQRLILKRLQGGEPVSGDRRHGHLSFVMTLSFGILL